MTRNYKKAFAFLLKNYGRAWCKLFSLGGRDTLAEFWSFAAITFIACITVTSLVYSAFFLGLYPSCFYDQMGEWLDQLPFPILWFTLYMGCLSAVFCIALLLPFPAAIVRRLRDAGVGSLRVWALFLSVAVAVILPLIYLSAALEDIGVLLCLIIWLLSCLCTLITSILTFLPLLMPSKLNEKC